MTTPNLTFNFIYFYTILLYRRLILFQKYHLVVPSPSETWFRGMSVGGSFRRLKGQAHPREMQPTGCLSDSACRLRRDDGMAKDGVPRCEPLPRAPIRCPSGGWRHARGREHCHGEPGSSELDGYAPDSAKAEGSSIIDEPGEG